MTKTILFHGQSSIHIPNKSNVDIMFYLHSTHEGHFPSNKVKLSE